MKVVVGLAEPGNEFLGSRGNIGAMALEVLAENHGILKFQRSESVPELEMADYEIANKYGGREKVCLLRPLVAKQKAGIVVKEFLQVLGLKKNSLIVIYDDSDFDIGQLRIRDSGGSGGHAGIRNIMTEVEFKDFDRIRIGVGRPAGKTKLNEYLTKPFAADEIDGAMSSAYFSALAVDNLIQAGLRPTQKIYNKTGLDSGAKNPLNKPWYPTSVIDALNTDSAQYKRTVLPASQTPSEPKKKLEVVKVETRKIAADAVVPVPKIVKQTPDWVPAEKRTSRAWSTDDDAFMRDIGVLPRSHRDSNPNEPYFL